MNSNIKSIVLFFIVGFSVDLYAIYLSGKVIDSNKKAIPFSTVQLQNTKIITNTNRQGIFKIKADVNISSKHITASKNGYLIGGAKFDGYDKNYTITLNKLPSDDFENYKFTPSLSDSITNESKAKKEKVCQDCHNSIVQEWLKDKHASSATNKNFLAVFKNGFKKDFPSTDGNCMRCHMPVSALKNRDNIDLSKLSHIEKEGISCDFCHKIKDITISKNNHTGIENMEFLRPKDDVELLFGPMHDVYPRFDAYASVYEQSKYCASCHNAKFWDVLVYSEYEEWKNSVYPKQGQSCQSCHMPQAKKRGFLADKIKGGYLRDKQEIHSHNMSVSKDFIKNALDIKVSTNIKNNNLYLTVAIKNIGAGHDIPTGSAFRNMILKVDVLDENSKELKQESDYILPTWSSIKGNGKVFAKIFRPVGGYSANKTRFKYTYPEHFYRPIHLESDTRIKAKSTDITKFIFNLKKSKELHIDISLSYLNFINSTMLDMNVKAKVLNIYRKKLILGVEK